MSALLKPGVNEPGMASEVRIEKPLGRLYHSDASQWFSTWGYLV